MKFSRLTSFLLCSLLAVGAFAQLPSIQLKNLEGKSIDTAQLGNDGKPFVIDFFATWCKPCNRELKAIHEVYPDWQEETGMRLVAISIDEAQNAQKVKPLVDSEGWEYEVLLDPNSDFFHAIGGQQIPFVVVVDGNGKIAQSFNGYIDGSENHIIEYIRGLLAK
jgi:peroxiredoxin